MSFTFTIPRWKTVKAGWKDSQGESLPEGAWFNQDQFECDRACKFMSWYGVCRMGWSIGFATPDPSKCRGSANHDTLVQCEVMEHE